MKKLYLFAAILPALALTACEDSVPYQKELETVGASKAVKVLTTEDGTVLWAYDPPNESTVYFSTGGTTQLVNCGKGCTKSKIISNTPAIEQAAPVTLAPPEPTALTPDADGVITVPVQKDGEVVQLKLRVE